MAIVYLHRRNDTNKVFYVGIGQQERRAYRTDNRNDLWTKIYKRHGRTVEIIHKDIPFEEACDIEIKLIAFYRAYLGEKSLANFAIGGQKGNLGKIYTDEQRKNISIAQKKRFENLEERLKHKERLNKIFKDPEYRKKLSERIKNAYETKPELKEAARKKTIEQNKKNPNIKNILSERAKKNWGNEEYRKKHREATIAAMNRPEIKEKIRISSTGRFVSEETRIKTSLRMKGTKVTQKTKMKIKEKLTKIILDTSTGIFYFGIEEAARIIGLPNETLGAKLRGRTKNNLSFIYT